MKSPLHYSLPALLVSFCLTVILYISCCPFFKPDAMDRIAWPSFRGHPHNWGFCPQDITPPLIMDWVFPNHLTVIRSTVTASGNRVFLPDWQGRIWCMDVVKGVPEYHLQTPSLITS